jgi:prepilin-type N-terminal cleavage/methylation domain-containing protein
MINSLKNNKGLTLIELLISVAILAFVVVGFLNFFVYSTSYIAQARQKSNTSAETQSLANLGIADISSLPTGTTIESTTMNIFLTPTHGITTSTIEYITIPYTEGNQTSTITTTLP